MPNNRRPSKRVLKLGRCLGYAMLIAAIVGMVAPLLAPFFGLYKTARQVSSASQRVILESARLASPEDLIECQVASLDPTQTEITVTMDGKKATYKIAGVDISKTSAAGVSSVLDKGDTLYAEVTDSGVWLFEDPNPSDSATALNFALLSLDGATTAPVTDRYTALVEAITDGLQATTTASS